MTHPPQGSDERGGDERGGDEPVDPDRFPTEPTPTLPPAGTSPTTPYAPNPSYAPGAPYPGPQYRPPGYGRPPAFGPAPYGEPPGYGRPQQYGSPYGVPQYPAPGTQYGPPPGPPAQKSRVGLIAAVTGVILLAIAGVVALVMSLQTKVLDPSAVERDVAAQFEQREGVAIELDCGDTMKVRDGATYTCSGRTADGEAVTLKITITDADTAAYTWTEP
jgi:hypothetical protein